jgi:hypothetical protein
MFHMKQQQSALYNRSIDLNVMPMRIKALPISPTGFPVPWFVAWFRDGKLCASGDGEPDFRVIDAPKIGDAMRKKLCWVCGQPLGGNLAFVIGPMCAINRIISEPPSHRDCAIYAAKVCPFLSRPKMVRNERALPVAVDGAAGVPLKRNPGAVCVWVTKSYRPFRPQAGDDRILFSLGPPTELLWFAEGRRAFRHEIVSSIESGYPELEAVARTEGPEAIDALKTMKANAMALLPLS